MFEGRGLSCQACTDARERMHHAFNDCRGCRARAVARSQHFARAFKEQRRHREYLQMIGQVGVTHDEVVAAAQNDRGCDHLQNCDPCN